jgi:hypothetical protein
MANNSEEKLSEYVIKTLGEKSIDIELLESKTKIISLSLGLPADFVQKILIEIETHKYK